MPLNIQHLRNGEAIPHRWTLGLLFKMQEICKDEGTDLNNTGMHTIQNEYKLIPKTERDGDEVIVLEGDVITLSRSLR